MFWKWRVFTIICFFSQNQNSILKIHVSIYFWLPFFTENHFLINNPFSTNQLLTNQVNWYSHLSDRKKPDFGIYWLPSLSFLKCYIPILIDWFKTTWITFLTAIDIYHATIDMVSLLFVLCRHMFCDQDSWFWSAGLFCRSCHRIRCDVLIWLRQM